jgi:hypothetical protein
MFLQKSLGLVFIKEKEKRKKRKKEVVNKTYDYK